MTIPKRFRIIFALEMHQIKDLVKIALKKRQRNKVYKNAK